MRAATYTIFSVLVRKAPHLHMQNLRTETGARTFVNSSHGLEDQYASLYAKCCADRSNHCRDM